MLGGDPAKSIQETEGRIGIEFGKEEEEDQFYL